MGKAAEEAKGRRENRTMNDDWNEDEYLAKLRQHERQNQIAEHRAKMFGACALGAIIAYCVWGATLGIMSYVKLQEISP